MVTVNTMRWLAWVKRVLGLPGGRGDAVATAQQREVWRTLARRHGLSFHPGPYLIYVQDDRLTGQVDGRLVSVVISASYELQKLVVDVKVACDVVTTMTHPRQHELVAWYDARRVLAGLPELDVELAPWVLGHREGVGATLDNRQLVYHQQYGIDAATLELMLVKLPTWAHQLELADRRADR